MTVIIASFVFFMLIFLGVGVYSATRKKNTDADYLVAGRGVGPWAMALSAVASNNSGYMFIGLIGLTFNEGLSALALMGGWVVGDYTAWILGIPKALRKRSEETGALTIPSLLGHGIDGGRIVVLVAGLIVLVFLGAYSAAQLIAGGKALHVLFGWNPNVGAVIGAVIVVIYCFAGGIRASIWTDVAQSMVMVVAMNLLLFVGVYEAGGPSALWNSLAAIDPQLVNFAPASLPFGFGLFLLGWFVAGFGVVGQPHCMVRAMTLESTDKMVVARRVYVVWNALFTVSAVGVGLVARVLLSESTGFDPELAMPMLSKELLSPVLVGLVLAGIFAATMSTADSQVLSCAAAVTQDIAPRPELGNRYTKLGTILVAAVVLMIALQGGSVFVLVILAWSGLAASLGPLLVVRCLGGRPHCVTAIAMMVVGFLAALGWGQYGMGYSVGLNEALPGMVAGFAIYGIGKAVAGKSPAV
jgi:sodium/proline symporter